MEETMTAEATVEVATVVVRVVEVGEEVEVRFEIEGGAHSGNGLVGVDLWDVGLDANVSS